MSITSIQFFPLHIKEWQTIKTRSFPYTRFTSYQPKFISSNCTIDIAENILDPFNKDDISLQYKNEVLRLFDSIEEYRHDSGKSTSDRGYGPLRILLQRDNALPFELKAERVQYQCQINEKDINIYLPSLLDGMKQKSRPMRIINEKGYLIGLKTLKNPGIDPRTHLEALLYFILTFEQKTDSPISDIGTSNSPSSSVLSSLFSGINLFSSSKTQEAENQWINTLVGVEIGCSSLMLQGSVNYLPCRIRGRPPLLALLTLSDFYHVDPNSKLIGNLDEIQAILCGDLVCYKPKGQDVLHLVEQGEVDPNDLEAFKPDKDGFLLVGQLEKGKNIVDWEIYSKGCGYAIQSLSSLLQIGKSMYIEFLVQRQFSTVTQSIGAYTFFAEDERALLKRLKLSRALELIMLRLKKAAGPNQNFLQIVEIYRKDECKRLKDLLGQACNTRNMVAIINPQELLYGMITQFYAWSCMEGETWTRSNISAIRETSKIYLRGNGQLVPAHVALEFHCKGIRKSTDQTLLHPYYFIPETILDEVWGINSDSTFNCRVYNDDATVKKIHSISSTSNKPIVSAEGDWILGPKFQNGIHPNALE